MLGEAAVGVGLADLVHLARQLRQQLHSHHAVLGLTLLDGQTLVTSLEIVHQNRGPGHWLSRQRRQRQEALFRRLNFWAASLFR